MDKNMITGFVLIAAVIIGFTLLNKPSEEDIARQREQYKRDSIEYAQTQQQAKELTTESLAEEKKENNTLDNFFATPSQSSDSLAGSIADSLPKINNRNE